jgi:hypothetical protein
MTCTAEQVELYRRWDRWYWRTGRHLGRARRTALWARFQRSPAWTR